MKELGEDDVPEIYWIKVHSGTPGNEMADQVAKGTRFKAEINQSDIYKRPDTSASFLNFHGLNPYFTKEWNRHWINEGNESNPHKHSKRYIPDLIESQSFEKIVLHNLDVVERRIVCRIMTGKVRLNSFLFKIKRSYVPECNWSEQEEKTVEHFLMECPYYQGIRNLWVQAVHNMMPDFQFKISNLKELVVGNKNWKPDTRIGVVNELVKFVLEEELFEILFHIV